MTPDVSIIIPVHNAEATIGKLCSTISRVRTAWRWR
jgi:glycosyltransferase involved in cell wall biosynthesis